MVTHIRSRFFVALTLFGLVMSILVVADGTQAAADTTFVVDTALDDGSLNACTLAPGDCSLRGAVAQANATPGADTIDFLIPAAQCPGGICPITLTEGPLVITEAVTIDATTQVQNAGPSSNVCATETDPSHMRIELVTDPTGADTTGLLISHATGASTIRGLAIGTNNGTGWGIGVNVADGSGHHISCNHFGADAAGTSTLGTASFDARVVIGGTAGGVVIGTDGDGSDDLGERNVFASAGYGVYVNDNDNNRISGNYFGFTADGTAWLSVGSVLIRQRSSNNLVGVDLDGISDDLEINYFGRAGQAITLQPGSFATTGNRVIGNVIGMGPTGTPAPATNGIGLGASVVFTGYEIRDNTIVNATAYGIVADTQGLGLLIDGNYIGITEDGTAAGNYTGIRLHETVTPQVSNNYIANSANDGLGIGDGASLAAGSTGNCIVGNSEGATNSSGSIADFRNNWWGTADGPSGVGPGTGDSVEADFQYDPWLTSPGPLCNTAPVADDASFSVAEDAPVATTVGTVSAADDGATLEYAITAGNADAIFAIDEATGEITTAAALDYEDTASYSLTVEVDDGLLADTATIEVTVTNVAPTMADASLSITEDVAPGSTVGFVTATDPGATLEYTITGGNTAGAFSMDSASGEIITAAALDFLSTPSYSLTVAASDGLLSGSATVDIAVVDVARFEDVAADHTFYRDIEWLAWKGITKSCNPPHATNFCPDASVTRGQMAAFLHRALGDTLTPAGSVSFTDDDGSIFEADIEWLGSVGVTKGCNPPVNDMFCPDQPVTRAQMAAFLVRALNYTAGAGSDQFGDDDGSVFEADIERLAEAGVTKGCNPPTNDLFCPDQPVTRGQMAAFLYRALG